MAIFALLPSLVFAHQPRVVINRETVVPNPEVSKAYYGKLTGEPDVYVIKASEPFDFYVNVLVPDIAGQKKDVSAVVINKMPIFQQLRAYFSLNVAWLQLF